MKIPAVIKRARVEIIGAVILAGVVLFWDFSRGLFIVTAFFAIGYYLRNRPELGREQLYYSLPVYGFVGTMFIAVMFQGFDDSGLNALVSRYMLLLLAVPLVSLWYSQSECGRLVWLKFALACLVFGITALVEVYVLDISRARGGDNAAIFGFAAAGISSIFVASLHAFRGQKGGVPIYVVALVFGLIAVLLSGTRGSWITMLVVLLFAAFFYFDRYSLPIRFSAASVAIAALILVSLNVPQIQYRADLLLENVGDFISGDQQLEKSSAWYRLEGIKAGWQIGLEHKLLGVGPGNFRSALGDHLSKRADLQGIESILRHAHNQYAQTLATSGFTGLAALLVLLGGHLWIFAKHLSKRYPSEVRSFALAGSLLALAYALLGLFGVPLERKKLILIYALASASCWGCLLANLRQFRISSRGSEAEAG